MGELFAIDGTRLRLAGGAYAGEPEDPSSLPEKGETVVVKEELVNEGPAQGSEAVADERESDSVSRSHPVKTEDEKLPPDAGLPSESVRGKQSSDDLEMADILRVVKPVEPEDFPVAGALPELSDVKRDDLARKAESRKKGEAKIPKKAGSDSKISKGGIRLGKGTGSDNGGEKGHNSIDESELW